VQRTARKVGVGFVEDREAATHYQDTTARSLSATLPTFASTIADSSCAVESRMLMAFGWAILKSCSSSVTRMSKKQLRWMSGQVGGYRILYSHNCQFGLSQMHDADKTSIATLVKVFPALAVIKKSDDEKISLVNDGIVEEVLLPLGQLDFGKGVVAKCDIGLWRTRGEHKSLVGEFALQVKFDRREDVAVKQKKLARSST
jgi:hypothetical protein